MSEEFDRALGSLVRAVRLRKEVRQQELADKLGISLQQMQKYEKGENRISCKRLRDISRVLDVRPGYFFDAEEKYPIRQADDPVALKLIDAFHAFPNDHDRNMALDVIESMLERTLARDT